MYYHCSLFVCLFGVYCISTFIGYLMPNPCLYKGTVLFQAIQSSTYKQFFLIFFFLLYFHHYYHYRDLFASTLADGMSLYSEWYKVSSSLQDSSQYSDHFHYCCFLDSLHSSSKFHLLQIPTPKIFPVQSYCACFANYMINRLILFTI